MATQYQFIKKRKLIYKGMNLDDLTEKLMEERKGKETQLFFSVHHRYDLQTARGKSYQALKNELTGGS